jgi:hypothetical protein
MAWGSLPVRCDPMSLRRLSFLLGFGTGYVLGAKAGRERYDTLLASWQRLADQPAVQGAAGLITAKLSQLLGRARA